MQFLTPGFFDLLVVIALIVGVVAAAIRIVGDFRRGPRWPEDQNGIPSDDSFDEEADREAQLTGDTGESSDD